MMAQASLEQLHAVVLKIAQKENFKSPKIDINHSPNHGYLASVNKITVQDAASDKRMHLFAKRMPAATSETWTQICQNEGDFYLKVMLEFKNIVPNNNVALPLVPKCYYGTGEMIVLEDIVENGFKVWNPKSKPLDVTHIKGVLQEYAKLHAFSFAFKSKNLEKFNSIGFIETEWFYTAHDDLTNSGYFRKTIETLSAAFDKKTEAHYIQALEKFYTIDLKQLLLQINHPMDNAVYAHSDCWTHNFMFRYDNSNKLKDICILDFQIFRKASPIIDLSYFLTTSGCSTEVFNSIDDYLKIYHQSLQEMLTQLNCSTDVYTWETLKAEWRKYSLKGFMMAAIILKMMIADEDELESRKTIRLPMQFDFISRNEAMFHDRIRILVKYFYDAGILTG